MLLLLCVCGFVGVVGFVRAVPICLTEMMIGVVFLREDDVVYCRGLIGTPLHR